MPCRRNFKLYSLYALFCCHYFRKVPLQQRDRWFPSCDSSLTQQFLYDPIRKKHSFTVRASMNRQDTAVLVYFNSQSPKNELHLVFQAVFPSYCFNQQIVPKEKTRKNKQTNNGINLKNINTGIVLVHWWWDKTLTPIFTLIAADLAATLLPAWNKIKLLLVIICADINVELLELKWWKVWRLGLPLIPADLITS